MAQSSKAGRLRAVHRRTRVRRVALAGALSLAGLCLSGFTEISPKTYLAPALNTAAGELVLASCGVRDTLWIDHYVAGLYLPPGSTPLAVRDAKQPKAVYMKLLETRLLPPKIPNPWRETISSELAREPMTRVRTAYDGLSNGDTITFTYLPQHGVTMRVNGKTVIQTPGHEVVDSILEAWAEGDSIAGKLRRLELKHPC